MLNFDHTSIGNQVAVAAQWLKSGYCVALPTETVYGLAANALDMAAVVQIFEIKQRPAFDPLIVHLPDMEQVEQYAQEFPAALQSLAARFWPGPLTLLLPKKEIIPDLVTSGLSRVALRVPAHPLAQALLRALPFPLAAPSANPFGYISPTTAQHVADQLSGKIPYILDGGPCTVGVESTIVGWEDGQVVVYRLGGISLEDLETVAGPVRVALNQNSNPAAPGMLKSHYSPRKPLYLNHLEQNIELYKDKKMGLLTLMEHPKSATVSYPIALSPTGDLSTAAQHLFAALRTLDGADIDLILAETMPDIGLGRAINDRLRRAATPHE